MVNAGQTTPFDLTGRVAVVTGGAGLLGRQHALALLEVGATVFLADIREDAARDAADCLCSATTERRAHGLKLDVSDPASVAAALDRILGTARRLNILINNAALDPKVGDRSTAALARLENLTLEAWNREIDVGLTGAFLCAKAFGGHMASNGGGVILNIASDLSVIAPDQRLYRVDARPDSEQPVKPATYSVIKTGLIGLTRYLATYWASANVRVNALSPGGVHTDQPAEFVDRLVDRIPLGRMAQPDEYLGAIQFLCSDASKYMTGQNIVIDGGRSVL